MSIDKVTMVLVDLTELPENSKETTMLIRLRQDDKDMIEMAAQALGLNQADFLRASTINTAKKVIMENAR